MTLKTLLENYRDVCGDESCILENRAGILFEASAADLYREVCSMVPFVLENTKAGEHIGLLGNNNYDMIAAFFALTCCGRVAVMLNKALPVRQLISLATMADVKYIIVDPQEAETAKELQDGCRIPVIGMETISRGGAVCFPAINEDDPALILFSSGTTGASKAVLLSHKNLLSITEYRQILRQRRVMTPLPPHHIAFWYLVLYHMTHGDRFFLNTSMKYFYRDIESFLPQDIVIVPQMLRALDDWAGKNPEFCQKLEANMEVIFSASAPFALKEGSLIDRMNIDIINLYGLTEITGSAFTFDSQDKTGGGIPASYNQLRIVDGELQVKGDNVMLGYYNDPEQTARVMTDGWFCTGDVARVDECQRIHIVGRMKNVIVLPNGENVNPEELETELSKVPFIDEAYIYEKEDRICAAIYNKEVSRMDESEKEKLTAAVQQAKKTLNQSLLSYQRIHHLYVREKEFTKTSTGKLQRIPENEQ